MDIRKFILRQTGILAIGEVICTGAMMGIFALLGSFDHTVIIGGAVGILLALINFFFMALSANSAADKAQQQNVKGGKATVQSSFLLRLLVIFVVLFAFAKSGIADTIAMVLPLAFVRPILSVSEFFRKPGKEQS